MGMFLFRLANVTKSFRSNKNDFCAVNHLSFDLPQRGLVSIVGKSGCGKSTLLNMLMGIEKPTSGSILFESKRVEKMKQYNLSQYHLRDVSMIYQHYNLLEDLSVVDNIALPLRILGKSNLSAHKQGNDLLKRFGLEALSKQKTSTLSGGEKQRVAILRALITNPKVVLCDEPTGALDENNSLLIMDELKKISQTKLVLMVSHNLKIVEKYSDRIITMSDGKIISDKLIKTVTRDDTFNIKKVGYKNNWILLLVKQLIKKNVFKGLFSFVSLMTGFLSILIGVGFIFGSEESQNNALLRNLAIGSATVSETSYYSLANSPLQFKKNIRPKVDLIDEYLGDFENIKICPNINYFFSPYPNGYFNDEQIKNFEMVPILNDFVVNNSVYPKIAGDFIDSSPTNVLVNREFLNELSLDKNECIGKQFSINYSTNVSYYTGSDDQPFISDQFSYNLSLTIVDVIEEFSFMNSPKVYYSYDAVFGWLENEHLTNISQFRSTNISVLDYIDESKEDAPETSYSSFLLLKNLDNYENLFSVIRDTTENEEKLQIESKAFSIGESYATFISSFKDALIFFLAIASLGVIFILGMISLSNFLENKKQSAILTCLGAKSRSISLIYLIYNSIIAVLAFISAFFLSSIVESFLNSFVQNKFGLANLIKVPFGTMLGLPFGFILIMFVAALLSTCLFTLIPILIYKNYSISEELRDE